MRETDFIERNKDKWERYEESLERTDQDPELLNQLYVHTTDDLSISRTFYPNRSVRVYLNGLAQRTFLQLYRGRRGEASKFFTFWSDELPRVVYDRRRPLFIALLVFVLSAGIGVLSYRIDPVFAETILGADYVAMTEANIAGGDPMAVYKAPDAFGMAFQITLHNLTVAFLTFIAGAFFCVGSVVLLIRNGVMLGVFQYFFFDRGDFTELTLPPGLDWIARGMSWLLTAGGNGLEKLFASLVYLGSDEGVFRESLLTIWIHGALEISSIVIAGGAGITLGSGLLFPGTLTRLQAFGRSARDGMKIMLGTVPLFIIAGFLEGYVTRQTDLPEALRLLFIVLCLVFIVWYYVVYPRAVAATGPPERETFREVPLHQAERLELRQIRTVGEQLSATFVVVGRGIGRLLPGVGVLALVFCVFSFAFGGQAAERYGFVDYFFGDLENFYLLLTSIGEGRGITYTWLVGAGFYGLFRLAFGVVYRYTDLERPAAAAARELRLLLVSGLLAVCFAFNGTVVALLVFLTLPFLLLWGVGGYTFDMPFRRVFRLAYTNLGSSYGLLLLLLIVYLPVTYLIDTVIGQFFFQFLDWVIYTDGGNIDARNVMLQAFCYYSFFAFLFGSGVVASAVALGSLWEVETAEDLRGRIARIGEGGRLRGMVKE
ncbi:putative membrane protein SpoIIM required for sporulation [Neolewinella xylanilytica]|uniref:Putative membrane protein SpoIIM required for sporulation n=1 Tax=Neolewinella xylanilytica TaxID=1514080 RepID=A0A2S6I744_9BACT|nr:stage II sporulation protein M [Neolewinella xylanilytica]PPK87315.1 putative membrane protein SpoIIM required for sporulation [Neolewinella xylanilytica]